jgi:DNA recombination-dependent growth factor C
MGILAGAMTIARFRVEGDLVDNWRDIYRDRLQEHAFREPPVDTGTEEVEGWVEVHNLLDAEFEDFNRWLYNDVALFALRVDKKRLPAKLFKATLQKKCEAWAQERGIERVPAAVRSELKDELEQEWLKRTLPAVSVTEAAWSVNGRYCILHSLSEGMADRFRKRFYRTFGLTLVPWSPLDFVSDDGGRVDALLSCAPSPVRLGGDVRLSDGRS